MSRSYKKQGSSSKSDKVQQHRKVREIVRDTLKHYDPDDDDLELPEVKMKRKPPLESGKPANWNRGPDKRQIDDLA